MLASLLLASALWSTQSSQPFPEYDAFVKATRDNLARAQREQVRYAYKERRTELHTNPFGRLGSGGVIVYDVTPIEQGRAINRRLIERDGKPVTGGEVERVGRADREARRPRRSVVDDTVAMFDFVMNRRETIQGRSVIVVSFTPKADANPETAEGRLAKVFKGSVWVDELAHEVSRVEATAVDDISFGMGLVARINQGSTVTLTRQLFEGTLWLPTSVRFVGQGRALLFRRLNIDQRIEWFDYRRLN